MSEWMNECDGCVYSQRVMWWETKYNISYQLQKMHDNNVWHVQYHPAWSGQSSCRNLRTNHIITFEDNDVIEHHTLTRVGRWGPRSGDHLLRPLKYLPAKFEISLLTQRIEERKRLQINICLNPWKSNTRIHLKLFLNCQKHTLRKKSIY